MERTVDKNFSNKGTYMYMAPELVSGTKSEATLKSDVWSLGCVLYEMCRLKMPFTGALQSICDRITRYELPCLNYDIQLDSLYNK
jgi:serine/threonine protein kinase